MGSYWTEFVQQSLFREACSESTPVTQRSHPTHGIQLSPKTKSRNLIVEDVISAIYAGSVEGGPNGALESQVKRVSVELSRRKASQFTKRLLDSLSEKTRMSWSFWRPWWCLDSGIPRSCASITSP